MAMAGIGHNRPPGYIPERRWIRVHEDWRDHPLVGRGLMVRPRQGWPKHNDRGPKVRTFNKGEAFEDLMFLARWKAGMVAVNGAEEYLEIGQLFGAVTFLAERWNWSDKTVGVWLFNLEKEGLIVRETKRAKGTAKANGNGDGEGIDAERAKGKGKGKVNASSFAPSVITICNYAVIQGLEQQISEYCQMQKGQREWQRDDLEKVNGNGEGKGQSEGQELTDRDKQTDIKTTPESRGGARMSARDPFGLNPYEKAAEIQRGATGSIELSGGKRAEWLELFNHDAIELELALKEVATAIQSNSTTPLQAQVERLLAKEARYRRERESRSEKRASRTSPANGRPGAAPTGMSIDERLRLERERKAQERQQ